MEYRTCDFTRFSQKSIYGHLPGTPHPSSGSKRLGRMIESLAWKKESSLVVSFDIRIIIRSPFDS